MSVRQIREMLYVICSDYLIDDLINIVAAYIYELPAARTEIMNDVNCIIKLENGDLAVGTDRGIKKFSSENFCFDETHLIPNASVKSLDQLNKHQLLVGSSGGFIFIINNSGTCDEIIANHSLSNITSVNKLSNDYFACCDTEGYLFVWKTNREICSVIYNGYDENLIQLKDGKFIISDGYHIRLYEETEIKHSNLKLIKCISLSHDYHINESMIELNDGNIAMSINSREFAILNLTEEKIVKIIKTGHQIRDILELQNGNIACAQCEGMIEIFDRQGNLVKELTIPGISKIESIVELDHGGYEIMCVCDHKLFGFS